ncbi:hypothetical protein GCM10009551_004100 [Nocardiopsis tropica]
MGRPSQSRPARRQWFSACRRDRPPATGPGRRGRVHLADPTAPPRPAPLRGREEEEAVAAPEVARDLRPAAVVHRRGTEE